MIPKAYIAQWRNVAPWNTAEQVEQGLVISRTIVELFSDEFLRNNVAFRGGTALYKLYLNPAPRYSEDIDLVQVRPGPIKPILKRIGEIITFFEEPRVVQQKIHNNTILYRFNSEYSPETRLRMKVEINCREHFNLLGWNKMPFKIENDWFSGKAEVTTYHLSELLGTKLRALYQRKKGRDLFDLFYAHKHKQPDFNAIISCYQSYIQNAGNRVPTKKEFLSNLEKKLSSFDFTGDTEGLLRTSIDYKPSEAFAWLSKSIEKNY